MSTIDQDLLTGARLIMSAIDQDLLTGAHLIMSDTCITGARLVILIDRQRPGNILSCFCLIFIINPVVYVLVMMT